MSSPITTSGPRVQCLECNEVIQSMHHHDWRSCKCGATFVDGGSDYLRVGGNNWKQLPCPDCNGKGFIPLGYDDGDQYRACGCGGGA
mgnify:CR=1 FL=1